MINYEDLTDDEKSIMYKRILRFHKENGSFSCYKVFKDNIAELSQSIPLHAYFINTIWTVVKKMQAHEIDVIDSCLNSSIALIEFLDEIINDKRLNSIKNYIEETIYAELLYFSDTSKNRIIGYDLNKKIEYFSNKYGFLSEKS